MTYPELFWEDRYMRQTHTDKSATMVGTEFKICASRCSKSALPGPICF